jgi:17beta-estradiol 17-dehydrogenase / very-long-chain 3-oxoacyl-CoA reductase
MFQCHKQKTFTESTYPVKTKIIVADFGLGQVIYDDIKRELQLLDIGVLVNNVGRMYDYPDNFEKVPEQLLWEIININVGAVTMLSRAVIPQMKEKRRGIIVNISSGSECQPIPLSAVYGASKIYVKNFSLGKFSVLKLNND